jgi:hypothetical protein
MLRVFVISVLLLLATSVTACGDPRATQTDRRIITPLIVGPEYRTSVRATLTAKAVKPWSTHRRPPTSTAVPPMPALQKPGIQAPAGKVRVDYLIFGSTNRASLTLSNATGNTEMITVRVPWSQMLIMEPGEYLYLSAQNERDRGSISCQIHVNGRVVEEANSSGAYVIASCSGSAR